MLPRVLASLAVLAALPVATASAQDSVYVPDSRADQGPCNAIPFGSFGHQPFFPSNLKYQVLVPWAKLAGLTRPVIEEIAFASCAESVNLLATIRIQMSQVDATALTSEFANNLGTAPVTVLDSKTYYWHQKADAWARIGLQRPFQLTNGKNLVIDIEVTGAVHLTPAIEPSATHISGHRADVAMPRLFACDWETAPPAKGVLKPGAGLKIELASRASDLGLFGIGCKGAGKERPKLDLTGVARPSGTVTVALSDSLASSPTLLVIGFNNQAPFPLALGFGDCRIYHSMDLALAAATDANGKLSLRIALPASASLSNTRFYTQFFQVEITNTKIGVRASNYGRVLVR